MAKLIMNPHSPSRRDVALPRTLLSIGRDPSNDLVLPDAMVSRRHAVIECRGSQYFLRDCNSSNGSLVNGDRVSERNLRDGDLVAIGAARLLFREELELLDSGGKVVQHPSAPRLACPACQADYRKGDVFCRQCGTRVQEAPAKAVCPSCGTAVALPARFCNACGSRLPREDEPAPRGTEPRQLAPQFEDPAQAASAAPLPSASAPLAASEPVVPPLSQADGAPAEADGAPKAQEPAGEGFDAPASEPARSASRSSVAPAPRQDAQHALRSHATPTRDPARSRPLEVPRPRVLPMSVRAALASSGPPAEPAAAGARVLAALVDALALGTAQALVLLPAFVWRRWALAAFLGALALGLAAAYALWFWSRAGQTPGMRALGLRVEGAAGERPLGWRRAGLRLLGCALSAGALGLGFLPLLTGGVALHDRLARTRVVRESSA